MSQATTVDQRPGRLATTQLVPTLCLTLLTAATAIGLCRVFPDWQYLRPMLVVAVGTHVVAALLRYLRAPIFVALPILLFAILELLTIVYYRDSAAQFLPGSRTFELMRIDLRLVISQFPTAVAPVPSVGNWSVAAAAALAAAAAMSDTFALRAMGRTESIVPTAVVFIFTSALGTDRHRVAVAALWIGVALLVVAVLRFSAIAEETAWMGARRWSLLAALPTIGAMVGLTAVAAAALAPLLPGAGDIAIVDTRNRQGSVTEVLSPIVDLGAQLRNRGNLELFTVRSTDGAHYWREIGLPVFDGATWQPSNEDLLEMGDRSGEVSAPGTATQQTITIVALGGHLVPAAYRPVRVSPDRVRWTADSQSLVLPDTELQKDDVIAVQTKVVTLSAEQLRSAANTGVDPSYYSLPGGVSQTALDLASAVTAAAPTAYDKAIALQNWFRSEFQYDTNVQLGNGNDAIENFLRIKRGFCQQFSGTFAVMARSLGLPTRVAVGFTSGQLGADGLFHVYGRHAHAWPEVWFDGLGWVAFEPTPGRGNADTSSYTGVDAQQDQGTAQPGDGTGNPSSTIPATTTAVPGATTTTIPGSTNVTTTTHAPFNGGGSGGGSGTGVPWMPILGALLVAALLWVLVAPRAVRALAHRHDDTATARVVSAWQRTLGALSLAGAPAIGGATPLEYADIAEQATGADHRALRDMATAVTQAVYSPSSVDAGVADRCDQLARRLDAICRERIPARTRLQMLFDVRLMRRRFAG